RLLSDPNLNVCPDHTSDAWDDIRAGMTRTPDEITTKLDECWTKSNDKLKARWAQQVADDEAEAVAVEAAPQKKLDDDAAAAARVAKEERLEAEKKKPKLGAFDANSEAPSIMQSRISPYAQKKLEKMEYCLLYPFGPGGLSEAASVALSSNDESFRLAWNEDNELTVLAGPSSTAHKNMPRDNQLSWRDFDLAQARFLKEIIRVGWPKSHIEALSQFFYLICNHSDRGLPGGEAALLAYADHIRAEWHRTLGTPESFNIALINDHLLRQIGDDLFIKRRDDALNAL
ncbi:hypothetical protein DFH07DRAFT_708587, partial [Mycena maculata]